MESLYLINKDKLLREITELNSGLSDANKVDY